MNKYIDYFSHVLINPVYYQRNYENDFSYMNQQWFDAAKRTALIALPFISLYKPAGKGISLVLGTCRGINHLKEAGRAAYDKNAFQCASQIMQTAIAITSVAGTILNFKIGLLITTSADMSTSLLHSARHLHNRNYTQALEELLQAASSALYLSIMVYGSLEIVLASLLIQGCINLIQARKELNQNRWPEFVAKLAMGAIRFNQANQQYQLIQRRNELISLEKFSKLLAQIEKGRKNRHLIQSPLHQPKEEAVMFDAADNSFHFGSHMHGIGMQIVKGMNVCFRRHFIDGKNINELEFKVNHVFRERLNNIIELMQDLDEKETREFLSLMNSHANDIKIEEVPFKLSNETSNEIGTAQKITFDGLGSILICNSPLYPNLYDRVRVEMPEGKTLYEMHELLSFFNLEDALKTSSEEDIERLKIGQLFRVYHPNDATVFERTEAFFNLSLDDLKNAIFKIAPDMDKIISEELPKMEMMEILPGRIRYTVPETAKKVYDLGGRGLITTITGAETDSETFDRVASILKMGILSSEVRYDNGVKADGLSPSSDFVMGGADSVYTQIITEKDVKSKMTLDNLYWGTVRVLFPLKMLNSGTYQYHEDSFGDRRLFAQPLNFSASDSKYLNRPSIFSFVNDEQAEGFHRGNEVMIKERISPELISGLVVPNEMTRDILLDHLRWRGIVACNDGSETIMGRPVHTFIHVDACISEQMFA